MKNGSVSKKSDQTITRLIDSKPQKRSKRTEGPFKNLFKDSKIARKFQKLLKDRKPQKSEGSKAPICQ